MRKPLSSEEALVKLNLLEKVSKERGDRNIETEELLAAMLLRGKVSPLEYSEFMDLTRRQIDWGRIAGYHMPSRRDMGMNRREYLRYIFS